MNDPLELPLRDIHLPGEISFWPPAPGWWIMAGLIVAAILAGWWFYRRNKLMKLSATRLARHELRNLIIRYETEKDPVTLLTGLSILLRRLSISLFPRTEVASLTGTDWLKFLDARAGLNSFNSGAGQLLSEAPYRRQVSSDEAELVLKQCQEWINAIASGKKR